MKTRVCMIQGGHFSASKGGAQYQAEVLVDQLVANGNFDVTYITRQVDPDFVPNGYRIEQIATPKKIRRYGFWLDAPDLYRRLRRLKPDVIYQQGLRAHTGIAALYARRNNARLIFHVASDFDVTPANELARVGFKAGSSLDKYFGEYGLKKAHTIVAQTVVQDELTQKYYNRSADLIVRNFHPPAEKVTNQDVAAPRVIWVANFKEVKRPELFVDLAESCRQTDATFTMIGRGGDNTSFGDLHERIDALPNLTHLGELSQDEVNVEIANSQVLVNTSLLEGFPNTFIQAWMRGLPVVTQGVNTDHLFDAQTIGVCGDSFEAMRDAVMRLLTDVNERKRMSAAALAYSAANHSMAAVQPLIDAMAANAAADVHG